MSSKMESHRSKVVKQLQTEQPKTFEKPDPPQQAPRESDIEKRVRALEFRK